jgi:hypothetical protein
MLSEFANSRVRISMTKKSRALIALEAQGTFAEYPFDPSQMGRSYTRSASVVDRGQEHRDLEQMLIMRQHAGHVKFVRDFLVEMTGRYPGSRFEELGITFFNTDAPNAVVLHDRDDDSYAIGIDYGMIFLFSGVFGTLLHSQLRNIENLNWVLALVDVVLFLFWNQKEGLQQRSHRQLVEQHYLQAVSSRALEMTFKFLVAHELGHIYLGHFRDKQSSRLSAIGVGSDRDEISTFDHDAEFAADAWSARVLRDIAGDSPVEQALARYIPSLYFGVYSLASTMYVARTPLGKYVSDTHPDAWVRSQRLLPTDCEPLASPDSMAQAIADLPRRIATERESESFHAAVADMQIRLYAMTQGISPGTDAGPRRRWWQFWR